MDTTEGQPVTAGDEGVGSTDQPAGDTTATPPAAWDAWEQNQDQHVAVKVNGEERLVPLREMRDGYMRQADYTQKTQTLAERQQHLSWAETIANALEQNPEQALSILQSQYLANNGAQQQEQQEFLTDEERQLAELQQWRQEQEQQQAVQQVEAELGQLQQVFGEDSFDPQQLLEYAIQGNFPNLSSAYQSMTFSEVYGEAQAVRDARAKQAQEAAAAAAAQEEQRQAAALVSGGHNVPPGSTQTGSPDDRLSVREAWRRAAETHNQ